MNCSMSLEELKKYWGCSPKTEDFHEFWEKKVNEVKEKKLEYSLQLSELQVDGVLCYDFVFKGTDGANIYCKYVRPKDDGVYPTLFNFHGYYMKGGALEVGKASTISFVWTSVVIIITNYFLTQILLS